ncbi:hypothetical protein [Anaerosporobacter faecicola]|uniref:hypothetical protein n=1 Tax=Anaerosporobacter faecicola TaxID=2718714 RepID=UPI00143BD469|nr:hypothetical protein [Anaerosporobacter faecicola]
MELLLTIDVIIEKSLHVIGHTKDICMIPFTAKANGPYFQGNTIGACVDTQKIEKTGECLLSARYMLEGIDHEGNPCHLFIENNARDLAHCCPTIVTDSACLAEWETTSLTGIGEPTKDGVIIRIYKTRS